ncbi:DUF2637 domain-containing protein [Micromonospora sp. C95]|uniref:DUF2637 domain-containing protein n=1 Tax=Micromonospora sp. C95 TaxID=2824882 RepID=UPI001B391E93|nr:DUF2637 domain-containing protein [Micromonospora sp. C95]MBQ1022769.1 DUF2637 domain-containing protein [Micromonospora sp. C95]
MSAQTLPAPTATGRAERPADTPATVRSLKRIRWAVRATLIVGVAASVAANILHAPPHPISQTIAAWPPVALLLTVELISRVPVHRKLLAAARLIATTAIAGIAAWVSYWHMVGVAARYGETGLSAYLLPVSVDGLIIVASISLVELSARLQLTQPTSGTLPAPHHAVRAVPPRTEHEAATSSVQRTGTPASGALTDNTAIDHPPPADPADRTPSEQPKPSGNLGTTVPNNPDSGHRPAEADNDDEPRRGNSDGDSPGDQARQRRRRGATRKAVIDAYREDPTQHPTTIAKTIGTSERTVRRYLDELRARPGQLLSQGGIGPQRHN